MISVIICSANPVLLSSVTANIRETIGVPYEVIAIDNSKNEYSICAAYNRGAEKAKFPVLCFMHEDILFETSGWGRLVCDHLNDRYTGLLGIAGGDAKSMVPSSWSIPVVSNEINIVQHFRYISGEAKRIIESNPKTTGTKKPAAVLDGVWLCTKKEVFKEYRFDEKTFDGFHGYDIDYSLQVNTSYNIYVIFDIVVHHLSDGNAGRQWVESAVLVSDKWKKRLPVSVYSCPEHVYDHHHWQSLQVFLERLFRLNYPVTKIIYYLFKYSFTRYFSIRRFLSMSKYVTVTAFKGSQ